MKNKALVIMLGLIMSLSAGFLFADKACAKPCPIEAICVTCRHHQVDCCKHCCCKDCKNCKDCKKCCETDKKEIPAE